jgi:DNA polymerase V
MSSRKPTFALIDCNNFFVSCERVFRPDLADKPVAVLSNNDGCIVARSQEVKALGIPMGAPQFKYRDILSANDVQQFSANFSLYGDFSRRVVEVLKSFTPYIEVYSVDESFLEIGSLLIQDYQAWAEDVSQSVYKQTGIPVSVGVASSKTLAKAATELVKQGQGNRGGLSMVGASVQDRQVWLSQLPIGEVWGIGRRLGPRLAQLSVRTALDLSETTPKWAKQHLTVRGERTVRELKGQACFGLSEDKADSGQKSLAVTRSFGRAMRSIHQLESAVASFATKASIRLRRKRQIAGAMAVFIRTGAGATEPFSVSTLVKLEYPTADTSRLVGAAIEGLERIYREEHGIKKAGVILMDLKPANAQQMTLAQLNQPERLDKSDRLMKALDQLNAKYGTRVLKTASEGPPERTEWLSLRQNVSPQYTTNWAQLATVK